MKIKKLFKDVVTPKYSTHGAACFDICAYFSDGQNGNKVIYDEMVIPTGLQFEVPEGFVLLIFSRSGHGFKNDVRLANCVGVIDSDYRGELMVKLTCDTTRSNTNVLVVGHGDRIAQGMLVTVNQVTFEEVDQLSETKRGIGGFGSTGSK